MTYNRIVLLLIFLSILFSQVALSSEKFFWKCKNDNCNLYATLNNGKSILASGDWTENYRSRSSYEYYDLALGRTILGCGNNCDYSVFVDFKDGKSSQPYYDVLAINPEKKIAVIPDRKNKKFNSLLVIPIFSKEDKSMEITLTGLYGSADVTAQAKFLKNGDLEIVYDIDEEGNSKRKVFKIDYNHLCK